MNQHIRSRGRARWAETAHGAFVVVETGLICTHIARVVTTALDINAPQWDLRSWLFHGSTMTELITLAWLDRATAPRLEKAAGRKFRSTILAFGPGMTTLTAAILLYSGSLSGMLIRDVVLWREPGRGAVGVVTGSSGGHNPCAFGRWQIDGQRYSGDLPYNVHQAKALNWQVPVQVSVHNPAVIVTADEPTLTIFGFCVGLLSALALISGWSSVRAMRERSSPPEGRGGRSVEHR
jgi:hypothetical protein